MFALEDAPVLPIHPRCHCSYCVPRDGDAAEITASGQDLEEIYRRKGVKGYGEAPKQYAPKGTNTGAQTIPASALRAKVDEAAKAFEKPEIRAEKPNAQAPAGNAAFVKKTPANAENMPAADLSAAVGNGIMTPSTKTAGDGVHKIATIQNDMVSTHWGERYYPERCSYRRAYWTH